MKFRKINLTVGLVLCLFYWGTNYVKAQNLNRDIKRYEIAVDLKNLFSSGTPENVIFKINRIKEKQVVGAYRFGLGASYNNDIYKITQDDKNYELTGKQTKTDFSLSIGYEYQKRLNQVMLYYGADLGGFYSVHDDIDFPNVNEHYNLFLAPFAGVKVFLTNNLALAFEAGFRNFARWSKTEGSECCPDNRQYNHSYQYHLELPYNLTFNFNF